MIEIRRRVVKTRYPRNGNIGMTETRIFAWDIFGADGKLLQVGVPTLREAKKIAGRRGNFVIVRPQPKVAK